MHNDLLFAHGHLIGCFLALLWFEFRACTC
jgi:hypothetical protein